MTTQQTSIRSPPNGGYAPNSDNIVSFPKTAVRQILRRPEDTTPESLGFRVLSVEHVGCKSTITGVGVGRKAH